MHDEPEHKSASESHNVAEMVESTPEEENETNRATKWRNLAGFWLLGLCNNFSYVIMLSAAHDILEEQQHPADHSAHNVTTTAEPQNERQCNQLSTGAILLADILPTLVIKATAPWYIEKIPYTVRVIVVIFFNAASYLIVSFSVDISMSLFGVVCASIGAGLGEPTFLSLTSYFDKNTVSTWSSGTGGAGVFGALSYAGIVGLGVTPRNTLLIMLVVPALLAASYYAVLVKPADVTRATVTGGEEDAATDPLIVSGESRRKHPPLTLRHKLKMVVPLFRFMVPLMVVYLAEYFINQGLFELIHFRDIWLTLPDQYRWYQVLYQVGVFISRSSVNVLPVKHIWILAGLQCANVVVFVCEAYYLFIGSIWIVFSLIVFEGLLGGSGYVNTFYRLRQETPAEHREYVLTFASLADTLGICIAGFISLPVHNYICGLPIPT